MVRWRTGSVRSVGRRWSGALELVVDIAPETGLGAASGTDEPTGSVRALAYPALVGEPQVGDDVLLNTAALERDLGTGGYALVVAVPSRLPAPVETRAHSGHLVKARYTPLQAMVLGVDEQDSEHHALLRDADSIETMPVVVADLHSALPAVLAGIYERQHDARVAYVMTDGGALPAWFSRSAATLREAGWLRGVITVGQAFGGDVEAVTVHTGLLAARHVLGVDIAVVIQGPGNLGTGTRWGFSGVAAGDAVNAVAALGGRAVGALRVSDADPRERHRGVSHHSLTAYGRVALAPCDVVVPDFGEGLTDLTQRVRADAAALAARHRLVPVSTHGLMQALAAAPVPMSSMGRGLDDDPGCFLASAAAGRHAADLMAGGVTH